MSSRRSWPLAVFVFAVLALPYPAMKYGPRLFSPGSEPAGPSTAAWVNPALTAEEEALELAGGLRFGDLVRLMRASATDPVARSFWDAFMGRPSLSAAWDEYRQTRKARGFQDALIRAPEFRELVGQFKDKADFRSALVALKAPAPARTSTPAPRGSTAESSLGMVRSGEIKTRGPSPSDSPAMRTGPGYDGEPQPGEAVANLSPGDLPTVALPRPGSELSAIGGVQVGAVNSGGAGLSGSPSNSTYSGIAKGGGSGGDSGGNGGDGPAPGPSPSPTPGPSPSPSPNDHDHGNHFGQSKR